MWHVCQCEDCRKLQRTSPEAIGQTARQEREQKKQQQKKPIKCIVYKAVEIRTI